MVFGVRLVGALDSRLWVADGGVRGRELVPETFLQQSAWPQHRSTGCIYRLSNLRMSACE
jgi:hypothetical protein